MIKQHWLTNARHIYSPNCNERPDKTDISLIVLHNISLPPGQFNTPYIADFFTNQLDKNAHPYFAQIAHLRVSSHLLIDRDGMQTQFVSFAMRAWHAGASRFKSRKNCNDFSIGIELEGTDNTPYTDAQYQTLISTLVILKKHYPIDYAVGHADIAPGRKTDPGKQFDWQTISTLINTPHH